jgi:hypothetical protein
MFEKYVKNGRVAVIISPGYGAGWSTWADSAEKEGMLFDSELVIHILNYQPELARSIAEKKYPESYISNQPLVVEWLDVGTAFYVGEYDGAERLVIEDKRNYIA